LKDYLEVIVKGLGAVAGVIIFFVVMGIGVNWLLSDSPSKQQKSTFISTDQNPNVHPELKKKEKPERVETTQEKINRINKLEKTPPFLTLKKNPNKYKYTWAVMFNKQRKIMDTLFCY
jgi:hypothetical protein